MAATQTIEPEVKVPESDVRMIQAKEKEVTAFIDNIPIIPVIESQPQFNEVNEITKKIRAKKKELSEERYSKTRPLDSIKKWIIAGFDKEIQKLEAFEKGLIKTMWQWNQLQETKRLELQKKADEEAARQKKKLEEKAKREMSKGDLSKAQLTQKMAESVVPPIYNQDKKSKGGVFAKKIYKAEVIDQKKFLQYCLKEKAFYYLTINGGILNKEAQNSKGQRSWPGVTISEVQQTGMRG